MTDCPPLETLDRLLREELAGAEVDAIVEHVEACTACQVALDRLGRADAEPEVRLLRGGGVGAVVTWDEAEVNAMLSRLGRDLSSLAEEEPAASGRPATKDADLPAIDGYTMLGELGRGGMGIVYKALHLRLNRLVALKMILAGPQLAPKARERFSHEAQAVARLRHPNIVQVYDFGEQDGRPYFSMELVAGGNLAGRLDGAPLTARRSAQLVEVLAGAVDYAHRNGVLHRDLKPANILVDTWAGPETGGEGPAPWSQEHDDPPPVKITDFGLSKEITESPDPRTQTGTVLGTPCYMAPEQARGRGEVVGATADVYALGVILYEPPDGPSAVSCGLAPGDALAGGSRASGLGAAPPAGRAARPGDDLHEMPGEGAAGAVRDGGRPGRRPAPVPRPPTDPARPVGLAGRLRRWRGAARPWQG